VYSVAAGAASAAPKKQAVVDQRDKQFVPYVTAVQVGTAVSFPNSDNIRHHVYSFSPAKKFELPLYSGVPAEPVVFDKVGFITLGCNIHDWMIAYIAVLPTPYFQVTRQDGRAVLRDLPAGQYTVQVWHPALKGQPEALAQRVDVGGGTKSLLFTLPLKHDMRAKRAPGLTTGGYR
jgi:plastocyanin